MYKTIVCKKCGKTGFLGAKGMCRKCYGEEYRYSKPLEWHIKQNQKSFAKQVVYREINLVHFAFRLAKEGKRIECEHCKYDKFFQLLCSHHLDPTTKDINNDSLSRWLKLSPPTFIAKLEKEWGKFILLCTRCHGEVHLDDMAKVKVWPTKPRKYGV